MKIEDIKIGMKVRIREWDDMEREHGLTGSGSIAVTRLFTKEMRRFCGVCAEVVRMIGDRIGLSEQFEGPWGRYYISADMLEPVVEEFTMPPPPDLGELHGVKLPAWFWREEGRDKIYALAIGRSLHVVCMINGSDVGYGNNICGLTPYTGQDLPPKPSVDELKRMARLVNNVR